MVNTRDNAPQGSDASPSSEKKSDIWAQVHGEPDITHFVKADASGWPLHDEFSVPHPALCGYIPPNNALWKIGRGADLCQTCLDVAFTIAAESRS